ncbi:hypothetical protein [Pontibacter harenae]|uniref:hypothetical protein n=1 Tax=Pontibacter harenae TaxID=2894083 RepID=UPI001E2DA5D4|nr:hypothetical protein [Pontibacter harenae]MCC9168312.1 hypothetical protein [Pontibacter harenae]
MFLLKKSFKFSLACVALLCASSCEIIKPVEDAIITDSSIVYTIKKGTHYSSHNNLKQVNTSFMQFEVTFDSSAVYTTTDPLNQGDLNKLYGFADCSSLHQMNSARFGWRWFENRLELHAYTYNNSSRRSEFITSVEIEKPYTYEIEVKDKEYVFRLDNQEVTLPRHCSGTAAGYQLYPYFGGDEVAPHDITIRIKEL